MGAYNWLIALLCIGIFGLLYSVTYDVVATGFDGAYTNTTEAQTTVNILWLGWKFLPVACIGAMFIYAYISGQKNEGY